MSEFHRFTEETLYYIIQPHPSRSEGLRIGFRKDGLVGLWMVEKDDVSFCLSPEAAMQLAELVKLHIRLDTIHLAT